VKRRARKDKHAAVRKALKRRHPTKKHVAPPKKRKGAASPHAITAESDALRGHAARWMKAHGKAHVELTDRDLPTPRRRRGGTPSRPSKVIQVQYRAGTLAHPAHPTKHVLISPRGKIVAEQG
jgi:hypothetical protein